MVYGMLNIKVEMKLTNITLLTLALILSLTSCKREPKVEITAPPIPEAPLPNVQSYNGHDYIDLGLSVKWATMNVGADSLYGLGDYFAWGEIEPKEEYTWDNYKFRNKETGATTKYCINPKEGEVDDVTQLELIDDVAAVQWGGNWRIPNDKEYTELISQCYWDWTDSYRGHNIQGFRVFQAKDESDRGKCRTKDKGAITLTIYNEAEDVHIFIPVSGYRTGQTTKFVGSVGDYWASTLYVRWALSNCGQMLAVFQIENDRRLNSSDFRYIGHTVRAVCP